jgi:medium-chain acyl-[acyl-carrier-protein] hydrolase
MRVVSNAKLSPWLYPIIRSDESPIAMICFPYAGSGASIYRGWSKLFSTEVDLYAVQAPGRETRFTEPFVSTIQELATAAALAIQSVTDKPIVLFGHSLGSACAYETARVLEGRGRTPELLIVSGRQCPGTPSKRAPISHLSDSQFLNQVRHYNGTPTEILENAELMEVLLPLIRSDFALAERYRPAPSPTLNCPMLALGSVDDEWLDVETLEQWATLTQGPFETHWFAGDHFYLNRHAQELVSFIKEKMVSLTI